MFPSLSALPLEQQLAMLRMLVNHIPAGVTMFDKDLKLVFYNKAYQELLDFPDDLFTAGEAQYEDFIRYNAWRGEYGPGDTEEHIARWLAEARSGRPLAFERKRPDGTYLDIRRIPLEGGGFVTIYTDISERKRGEERLRLMEKIFSTSPTAVMVTDANNRIVMANPAFTEITGFASAAVLGQDPKVLASGRHDAEFYRQMWASIDETGQWSGEIWDRRQDGSIYPKWLSIHTLGAEQGKRTRVSHYVAMFTDITERKQAEERIHHLAHHDPLTGLANRLTLESRLLQALADARRYDRKLAVLFIDLDRFKTINDSLGHQIGDLMLIEVARRLTGRLRLTDVIARLGGDEFVVVVPDLSDVSAAAQVAQQLIAELNRPIRADRHVLHTSGSVGIAVYPGDGETVEALMKNADTAMYHAKEKGRDNFQFFSSEMTEAANERLLVENRLRSALGQREFILHYQPKVDPANGRICGLEALVRWQHPVHGIIAPERFIRIAEETGLIVGIGQWVIGEACRQASRWRSAGHAIRVAVNLSARQLRDPGLFSTITDALFVTDCPAAALELEITESALMQDPRAAIETLGALKALGISLALDDFGTGYSSLSYLKLFPLDRLKIDRSFVRDIDTDSNDRSIALSTIALAHSLNLQVTAEGVELASQHNFIREHGCDEAQGWLFSRALPAEAIDEVLTKGTLP
jgi:diguanylate cyclase (GGDEF)-like protein/PAS domain S-box-containing protein